MNLQDNDFALFGLKQAFLQDRAVIDARWKELQREAHPDKFASHGPAAQRVAMQWSVRINEAYQRLKDPLKRAGYLCELAGFPTQAHSNTAMPPQFLMQQMEWREALEDATDASAVEALLADVQVARKDLLQKCAQDLDERQAPSAAVASVRALMFIDKFVHDLNQRLDQFE